MKVALVICNDMHMDIANANTIVNHLMATGYEVVCDYTIADTVIILTCAFGPHKIVCATALVHVRAFRIRSGDAPADALTFGQHGSCGDIDA